MNSTKLPGTQWIMIILFTLTTVCSYAQRTITWKGGTPGMKSDWFCPQNWSSTSLPDEFSDVIIPDVSSSTFAPPYIKGEEIEINSLQLQSNSSLTIAGDASLTVNRHIEGMMLGTVKGKLIFKADPSIVIARFEEAPY